MGVRDDGDGRGRVCECLSDTRWIEWVESPNRKNGRLVVREVGCENCK